MTDLILRIFVRDHKNTEDPAVRDKCGRVAGAVGIVTNFLLFLMKIIVGTVFHSVSVTADAVNNLTDSGSSVVTLIGFKMASKPADEKHPFGHARIEYLSGVIVSFIVIFLGLQLGMSSIEKILTPEENALTPVALVVLVISILAKLWQCLFYRKVGRMIKSESVEATSKDSRNDVIATSVVLLGRRHHHAHRREFGRIHGRGGCAVHRVLRRAAYNQHRRSSPRPSAGGRARTDHYRENALVSRHHRHA